MKTTVEIADPLLEQAKLEADRTGCTLRELVERGLRIVLEERRRAEAKPFRLRDASVGGHGLEPGARDGGWPQQRAMIYGDDDGERR